MVLRRDYERVVKILKSQIDRLCKWGLMSAAIYTTKSGSLHTYGSVPIIEVFEEHKGEVFSKPDYCENAQHLSTLDHLALPLINPPLSHRNFQSTRRLAVWVVKADYGGMKRRIGWGKPESKPQWWPEGVPWTTRGLQSGVNQEQLKAVIRACYAFHGQPVDEDELGVVNPPGLETSYVDFNICKIEPEETESFSEDEDELVVPKPSGKKTRYEDVYRCKIEPREEPEYISDNDCIGGSEGGVEENFKESESESESQHGAIAPSTHNATKSSGCIECERRKAMHPDLSSHLHTAECNEWIAQLHKCHQEFPFRKFLGYCNEIDRLMGKCLDREREMKRKANREKHKTKRSKTQASS